MSNLLHRYPSFRNGVHPPESKADTHALKIRQFPFSPVLVIPLSQHIGAPAVAVVREGEEVARGQLLARSDGFMSVPQHAPASGIVQRIDFVPSITGKMVPGIYLKPHPGSSQEVAEGEPCDLGTASPDDIIAAVQSAGIVGLGGAAFPTHVKLKPPEGKTVETLIINGIECEPYLTTDHRVMLEHTADIYMGIRYLLKATTAQRAIIGVEANKLDAADALRAAAPDDMPVTTGVVEVKYPQGAEKMLITALLGKEVPSGGLPVDVGTVVVNVATAAEIGRLLPHGRGIQERVVTITGPAVGRKGNYRIPIGTPLRFALEQVDVSDNVSRVFLGGPMMGQALSSLDIPITKGTSGFVAFTSAETAAEEPEYPCIRCAYCVDACPIYLNPSQLGILAKNEEFDRMADDHSLMDCFECGACSYVCPSHIPLVQRFRDAKAIVRERQAA
ncbi:MAG: electron transport complex subunit RsxC [Gammaproteobacteria bacterium]|nr:electron transport complex subunit RsxC [Gammaproteobacteria bacterium]MDH3749295.1 electron transport complex subunit RsxC [Gammaproteobacteria bacterium]MDH3806295.1 electron transport complex subunit RsxC [Gammaproteobacteria bacterium]